MRGSSWLPLLGLAVVGLVFAPVWSFEFVNWDDDLHLYRNALVLSAGDVPLLDHLLTPQLGYPSPITVLSYRVEHALFGLDPTAYHATNWFLHLAACALVYRLGRRLSLGAAGATVALLCFGLHPVVAEPVSWVSGRKDLLAAVFALWCLLEASSPKASRRRALLPPLLFVVATLAKPTALFIAPVALLWLRHLEGLTLRAALRRTASLWLLAVPLFALALLGQLKVGAISGPQSTALWLRQVIYALGYHAGLAFFAQEPAAKHIPKEMPPAFDPWVDLAPLVIFPLLALGHWLVRPQRGVPASAALAFAALAYLPSANVFPLTRFLADSYLYLPLVGLGWFAGVVAEALGNRLTPALRAPLFVVAGALLALALGSSALTTSAAWRNGSTLWRGLLERYPDSPQVCMSYGNARNEAGTSHDALLVYELCARRFGPTKFSRNIAITLFKLGRRDEAVAAFQRILAQSPGDPIAQKYLTLMGSQ